MDSIQVFINNMPEPTFKLRQELGGHLASSRHVRNPASMRNTSLLEGLQGNTLQLEDGLFVLTRFQDLGNWDFAVELTEISPESDLD